MAKKKKKSSAKKSTLKKSKAKKKTGKKKAVKKAATKKSVVKKTKAKKTKPKAKKAVKKSVKKSMPKAAVKKAPAMANASATGVIKPMIVSKPSSGSVRLNQPVPDFQAESTSGVFKLSNFKGKKVVLYFYPKDNTSGCTLEGHDFTNALEKFKNKNTVVFGISKDSVKSHQGFIAKQYYKHHLISDENEKVCQLFGVIKEKSMYGRSYLGIERSTFLIDENGVLKAEWRNVKVTGHVDEVLAKI